MLYGEEGTSRITRKLRKNIVEIDKKRKSEPLAFLVLGGSFNPIHNQHKKALEIARNCLKENGFYVCGGFLGISSQSYLVSKLGISSAMK
eukprot:CAMPEP_0185274326 /NCGR_PEP_ID=MMETSP1359-20130426/51620_1 /TAXON_ID=552665 /ORGANISM="Bigelowiella longifila, Strain CCMP242" /LENGTH=89 /DNA_ID=CAMNT_0027867265 /DNA_START=99 /DNA_END=365 /DNA_ORIENTATION=-